MGTTTTLAAITDELYNATEARKISQIMTVDQSSAFDCINHETLMRKMRLYNMDDTVIQWVGNYLSERYNCVQIGAAVSERQRTYVGVPQGSVVGPLLYALYINEMTEVVRKSDCRNQSHSRNQKLFGEVCTDCGSLNLYADDATYCVSSRKRLENREKLEVTLDAIQKFLSENDLHLNVGKTAVVECMIPQKKGKTPGQPPGLLVEEEQGRMKEIRDKGMCRILGVNIQGNMTWTSHLESGDKAILPKIRKQLGALIHQGKKIPKSVRKTLATGLILGRLQYVIAIWGSTSDSQIRKAQTLLNKTARWVTGLNRRTRISRLLEAVGWLTIKEMALLQGCTLLWKILHLGKPAHLRERIKLEDDWSVTMERPRLRFSERCFKWKTCRTWNLLSEDLRKETELRLFKKGLKVWILGRRPRDPVRLRDPDPD